MKTTSIFGGVQVFNIVISLVRSKFIALFLGPAGIGIAGLLTSTTGLIATLTNFGLGTSAVKDVSEAHASGDKSRLDKVVAVFKRLLLLTGLLGTVIVFLIAPLLSKLTFGNSDYSTAFRIVSITLFLGQLATGQMVILQGMRLLHQLAKANMIGSLIGLLISLPIYYWLGVNGIVPAILIISVSSVAITLYFTSKIKFKKISISRALLKVEGSGMLKMGFVFSVNGISVMLAAYILGVFIARYGGVAEVGLYNAGFAIVNTYVGMIFSAMATDFFPRLSAVSSDNSLCRKMVNQQAYISILIIAPILTIFLVFINAIIIILYSVKFLPINEMIQYVALGILLKTVTWAMGFMIIVKGNSKLFFFSELIANGYMLISNILFYKYYGLTGIGISFILSYILALLQTYIILHLKYKFSFDVSFYKIVAIHVFFAVSCFVIGHNFEGIYRYLLSFPLVIAAVGFSLYELNKKMDILSDARRILLKRNLPSAPDKLN
jgi:O-antigen/teichoic acid export membrane protein